MAIEAPLSRHSRNSLIIVIVALLGFTGWTIYDGFVSESFKAKHTGENGEPDSTLLFNRKAPPYLLAMAALVGLRLFQVRRRKIIAQEGGDISRVKAANCIDMLSDAEQRESIRGDQKVYWLSPGWLKYWMVIFKEWDIGLANETFPQNDKAILLDALGFFDGYSERFPERILRFSDWMRIGIEPYKISLDRLRGLLLEAAREAEGGHIGE